MIGYQDIRFGDKLYIIKNNIKTAQDIDNYFIGLGSEHKDDISNFKGKYFLFPDVSDKYYKYDQDNAKEIYLQLVEKPDNWGDSYNQYYMLNENGNYKNVDKVYVPLMQKPNDWEDNYDSYYVITNEDNVYELNTDPQWPVLPEGAYRYLELVVPPYESGKYFYMAISCGVEVAEKQAIMNTVDMINSWRNCLSNGKLKLLKAPNGQSWVVSISDQTQLNVMWDAKRYPSTIDFNWQEMLDKDKISIIKW
jgi:hypothetical protein